MALTNIQKQKRWRDKQVVARESADVIAAKLIVLTTNDPKKLQRISKLLAKHVATAPKRGEDRARI